MKMKQKFKKCSKCGMKIKKIAWLNTKPVCMRCYYKYKLSKNRTSIKQYLRLINEN